MTFEIYAGNDGWWYWRLKAGNGRIVADGAEGYSSKGSCKRAVTTFKREYPWFIIKAEVRYV